MRNHKLYLLLFFALIFSGCLGGTNSKINDSIDVAKAQQEVNAVLDEYELLQRAMYLPNILTRDETIHIIGRIFHHHLIIDGEHWDYIPFLNTWRLFWTNNKSQEWGDYELVEFGDRQFRFPTANLALVEGTLRVDNAVTMPMIIQLEKHIDEWVITGADRDASYVPTEVKDLIIQSDSPIHFVKFENSLGINIGFYGIDMEGNKISVYPEFSLDTDIGTLKFNNTILNPRIDRSFFFEVEKVGEVTLKAVLDVNKDGKIGKIVREIQIIVTDPPEEI